MKHLDIDVDINFQYNSIFQEYLRVKAEDLFPGEFC